MKTNIDTSLSQNISKSIPQIRGATNSKEALKKACQDFEALFIQSMFKAMRKTVPEGGLFSKQTATTTFEEMLDQEIAGKISQKQSVGLADQMYRQMEKTLPSKK